MLEFLLQLRQDGEEVADEAVIGDLEDRRLLVLVDGDDDLGILHAGKMLDGAGNADRDIEIGRHHLAGLADLPVVRGVAGIDRGARGAHGGAELVGDRLDVFGEVLRRAERAPARDDDPGRGQLRPVALGDLLALEARNARIRRRRDRLDRRRAALAAAGKNAAVRTVITFLASVACTVWMALPA